MKNVQKIDLGLTGYDELFMNDAERKENKLPRIYDVPISEIDDFPGHPFKVKVDEDMDQLVQSIKERGIITPVTLRPKEDGRYEIVSGHRRKKACELAGLDTVKAEVREMTRDEAIILMVESNLQRSTILPSEKAFSYKMRLEAMKRQAGRPSQDNSSPVGIDLRGKQSLDVLGEEVGDSRNQVHRYIRLTELIPELLQLVDESRIAFRPAVELSYLKKEEQTALLEEISYTDVFVRAEDASKINRIFERFGIATADIASARGEIVKEKAEKGSDIPEPDRHTTEKDKDEAFLDALLTPTPNKEEAQTQNPTEGPIAKSRQSEPTSKPREKTARGTSDSSERSRPSVREEMKEIREKQRQRAASSQKTKDTPQRNAEHIDAPKKKKEKER